VSPHRHHWLLEEDLIFLNHGSFGACPRVVLAEQARLREEMEREPVRFLWREIGSRLDAARAELARLLAASVDDLAFVSNATSAVNAVVRSLELEPDDELLTTDHGYNACRNVLEECARRSGARVVVVKVPFPIAGPGEIVTAVEAGVSPRTRLVLLDHVTSPTAIVFPVEEMVRSLEERGIAVLIDGAHAPGMLPLNLDMLGASYYTGNLHKWMCAPKGAGFLHVRRDRQAGLHPATLSHGYNTARPGRSRFQDEFDWQGTLDVTSWLSVPAAIRFCESLLPGGLPAMMQHNRELAIAARELFTRRLNLAAPAPETMLGSMVTFPLPPALQATGTVESRAVIAQFDPLQTWLFERHRIEVPVVVWGNPARRWFRVSAHLHNELSDYERLADALIEAKSGQMTGEKRGLDTLPSP
jgi:isopenicillin-N epimerase